MSNNLLGNNKNKGVNGNSYGVTEVTMKDSTTGLLVAPPSWNDGSYPADFIEQHHLVPVTAE